MSTTVMIRFRDSWGDQILVRRGDDGSPDIILRDLHAAIEIHQIRLGSCKMGQLVATLLEIGNAFGSRVHEYEPVAGYRGDENYCFEVTYDRQNKKWTAAQVECPKETP